MERVFVNLEAVYPNPNDSSEEYSFEELRAKYRGWLAKSWQKKIVQKGPEELNKQHEECFDKVPFVEGVEAEEGAVLALSVRAQMSIADEGSHQGLPEMAAGDDGSRDDRSARPRKKKIMEVRAEAQTSRTLRVT